VCVCVCLCVCVRVCVCAVHRTVQYDDCVWSELEGWRSQGYIVVCVCNELEEADRC